jgi:hypothetical protein
VSHPVLDSLPKSDDSGNLFVEFLLRGSLCVERQNKSVTRRCVNASAVFSSGEHVLLHNRTCKLVPLQSPLEILLVLWEDLPFPAGDKRYGPPGPETAIAGIYFESLRARQSCKCLPISWVWLALVTASRQSSHHSARASPISVSKPGRVSARPKKSP